MARRRYTPRASRGNKNAALMQIALLALMLAGLLFFRDKISLGAGNFFSAMSTPSDLQTPPPPEAPTTPPSHPE
jgi:hypothetical protein